MEKDNPSEKPQNHPVEPKKPYMERKTAEYTERALHTVHKASKGHPIRNAALAAVGVAGLFMVGYATNIQTSSKPQTAVSYDSAKERSITHIREELIEGVRTRNQGRLNALTRERNDYVKQAMYSLANESGIKINLRDGSVSMSLSDPAMRALAEGVAYRYDILRKAQADRAEKQRAADLKREYKGFDVEGRSPEELARYRQTLNVKGENEVGQLTEEQQNEQRRQAILNGARNAAGQAVHSAGELGYNIQNNPQRTSDQVRSGVSNAVNGQLNNAGRAVEQGRQDLANALNDLNRKKN